MPSLAFIFHPGGGKNSFENANHILYCISPLKRKCQITQHTEDLVPHQTCSLESLETENKQQKFTAETFCLSWCSMCKASLGRNPSTQKNLMMKDSRFLSGICLRNDLLWENRTIDHRNTNHVRGLLWNCFSRWLEPNINIACVWKQGWQKRDHKAFRVLKKGNAINIMLSYGGTALWFSLFCYNITSLTHTDFPA